MVVANAYFSIIDNGFMQVNEPSTTANFNADQIMLFDVVINEVVGGNIGCFNPTAKYILNIDISKRDDTTPGSMHGGDAPSEGFVAVYIVSNVKGGEDGLLTGLVAVNATETKPLPNLAAQFSDVYSLSTLISVWRVADSKLVPGIQKDRSIYIEPTLVSPGNPPAPQEINNKDFGRFANLNSYPLDKIVPLNTKTVSGYFTAKNDKESGAYQLALAGSSEGMGIQVFAGTLAHTTKSTADIVYFSFKDLTLLEAQKLYGELTSTSLTTSPEDEQLFITGYTI